MNKSWLESYQEGFADGKADSLKEIPRWKQIASEKQTIKSDEICIIGDSLYWKNLTLKISDLKVLPIE